MSSKSRSRSRSSSRSPKRYRRNARDDSMSPIRTASGANLRTPKNYNSGGYGYRNYNYRGGYNNRGYYNQRYNYGRWNRGRGNYRGGWQNRNQWNQRSRYNSRSDRSRSRSRSRSYDRDRSRSSSYSRSRSRSLSRDRNRRRRSPSARSDERRADRSKSKSKSPPKIVEITKEQPPEEKTKQERAPAASIEVPSMVPEPEPEPEIQQEPEPHFAETSAFTRSRWESPDAASAGRENQITDMDLEQDQIFDQWDDDKLREYLLKSKGKKLGKDAKKLLEDAENATPLQVPPKQKKKKRSKSNAESPTKETRGRKKKRTPRQNRSTSGSSSSSSSFSPIHKAPGHAAKGNTEAEETMVFEAKVKQMQDYSQASNVYSQQQSYSASNERTQAVQYPFSHIRKPTPQVSTPVEPAPPPPVPAAKYPAPPPVPVPPPQPSQPIVPATFGEMQVLGPDGRPMRLVPTSVPGPDGKMIQIMQVVQDTNMTPTAPPPVSAPPPLPPVQPKQEYKTPPPPPSYPPPPGIGKYPTQPSGGVNTATEIYKPEGFMDDDMLRFDQRHCSKEQAAVPASHSKEESTAEKRPYEPSNHTSSLKKMEMVEKQKRRQDVVKTRFTPRPAGSWAQEVKKGDEQTKASDNLSGGSGGKPEERGHAIPSLADPANRTKRPTHEEFANFRPEGSEVNMMSGRPEKKTVPIPGRQTAGFMPMQSVESHSTVQNPPGGVLDNKTQLMTGYPSVAPPSYSQAEYKPMLETRHYYMGPNGETVTTQMQKPQPSAPVSLPAYEQRAEPYPKDNQATPKQQGGHETAPTDFIHKQQKPDKSKEVFTDDEEDTFGAQARKRTISAGSERKMKKKMKSVSSEDSAEDEEQTKRKKEKKKKKKNKKKKEQGSDETPVKDKKKKKEKKQKEKPEVIPLEHETIKSKKDIKAFEEVQKKSKEDGLIRSVSDGLPLSHIRAMVPRRKGEGTELLLRYVKVETTAKASLATSTSYEDRFVSLFGSGEPDVKTEEPEERIDLTKKSVRKFRVSVKGTRDVAHMTGLCLSDRIKQFPESDADGKESQKVSLNVSSLSKASQSTGSPANSRSRSRSSSASSASPKKSSSHKKNKKKKHRSRSSSRSHSHSESRSKSRSVSLPRAYSSMDDKTGRRGRDKSRSKSKEYSEDDLRHDLEKRKAARNRSDSRSRSRSRSYSDEDRSRNRGRQAYQNRNNQGYYYNRGRGRGYFQNYRGGRGWYNNRGNFRGRWNWNNQGWNRNQGYRYGRYDGRDRNRDRSRDRSHSRSRSRSRDDRSSSREKDDRRDRNENVPKEEKSTEEQQQYTNQGETAVSALSAVGNGKTARKPSPAHWSHDMFEEHEAGDGKQDSGN